MLPQEQSSELDLIFTKNLSTLSKLYPNSIIYSKPDLTFEPTDDEGKVTLQGTTKPSFHINVPGGRCCLRGLNMLLKGPNKDECIVG